MVLCYESSAAFSKEIFKTRPLTLEAAAALATAMETPRIALAPNLPLLAVPSSLIKKSSTAAWSVISRAALMRAGPMMSLTFLTAIVTP